MWNSGCVGDFKPRCQTPQRILVSKIQKERGTRRNKVRCAQVEISTRVPTSCQLVSLTSPNISRRGDPRSSEIIRDHPSKAPTLSQQVMAASRRPGYSSQALQRSWRIAKHRETWRNMAKQISGYRIEFMYDHVIFSLFQDERLNSACQIHPFGHKSQVHRSAAFCST